MTYRTVDVGVRGGALRVGVWESPDLSPNSPARRTVLGIHGITSSHLVWELVAQRLVEVSGTRFIAPDLRGRGRSAELPGPWGMQAHADDMTAVVGELGRPQVTAGHSMGGFVAVVAVHRRPELFGRLVLVDGGVPLPLPTDEPMEVVISRLLGPTSARLAMRFPDPQVYRRWWRAHPAFVGHWSATVDAYVDYDLVPDGGPADPHWRSGARMAAVAQDFPEQGGGGVVEQAWTGSIDRPAASPVVLLRAPLGLQGEPPGLYPRAELERFATAHPGFRWIEVPDTNHYTLLLGDAGAAHVSAAVTGVLEGAGRAEGAEAPTGGRLSESASPQ